MGFLLKIHSCFFVFINGLRGSFLSGLWKYASGDARQQRQPHKPGLSVQEDFVNFNFLLFATQE